jgi:hypothetical protein
MRDELGVASPSKVAHGIGQNVGQGLANGIASTQGIVTRSAVGIAHAAVPRTGYVSGGAQVGSPTQVSNNTSNVQHVTVNAQTNADAVMIAREAAWAIKTGVGV